MSSTILIINPNSSTSVTEGLKEALSVICPAGISLTFFTGSEALGAPPSINDTIGAIQSANACFSELSQPGALSGIKGVLVCCFSDHPLVLMLQEAFPTLPVLGIFQASLLHSMALTHSSSFGILTTGDGAYIPILKQAVRTFMGGNSERYGGCITTGLGVVELREGDPATVKQKIGAGAVELVKGMGRKSVIILGCAGMAGMEHIIVSAVKNAGLGDVVVVDGAKAGISILSGLVQLQYFPSAV